MSAHSFPPHFEEERRNGMRLICDAAWRNAIVQAGLLEAERFEALWSTTQGRRSAALRIELPGIAEKFFLRPVVHGGLFGPLLGATSLGLLRPLHELSVTSALRSAGANVPRPAFVLGRAACGHAHSPIWKAALATVAIEGGGDGMAFLTSRPDAARIQRATQAAAHAIRKFHDCGGQHADLQIKNLFFVENPNNTNVFLIDLDRARIAPQVSAARRMQELMRLYRSLLKRDLLGYFGNATAQQQAARDFLDAYTDGDAQLKSNMLTHLGKEKLRVALHRLGYPKRKSAAR